MLGAKDLSGELAERIHEACMRTVKIWYNELECYRTHVLGYSTDTTPVDVLAKEFPNVDRNLLGLEFDSCEQMFLDEIDAKADREYDEFIAKNPRIKDAGPIAFTAALMAHTDPQENDPEFWDRWKVDAYEAHMAEGKNDE